ncbi:MAG: family 4 glycosyl hydrolase [Planctomycetota bacterium]|jgi:alpha-galactosidase
MAVRKKIVYIGGGSLYFESVTAELATTEGLPPLHIVFYDPDKKRNDLMFRIGHRIVEITGADITFEKTQNTLKAIDGADFAIASVGVHGPKRKWHLIDSKVAAKFGIITTTGDTVGPSGISQGLRLIPIMVDLAKKMEKYCPDCIILNHSNPMGAVVRAVQKYTKMNIIGYCHNTAATQRLAARALKCDKDELDLRVAGVNHMVWLLDILRNGKSVYKQFKKKLHTISKKDLGPNLFARDVCDVTGLFPIGGDRHIVEFFHHARAASKTKKLHYGMQWRVDMIEGKLLDGEISKGKGPEAKAAGKADVWIPKEGEASPEAMGHQVKSLLYGPDSTHFLTTRNNGAVPNLPDWAAIEVSAVIGQGGARAVALPEMPAAAARWTLPHIYNNEMIIEAAVENNRQKAIQAMASDHMVRDFHEAAKVFDALVKAHGDRLKKFKKKPRDLV